MVDCCPQALLGVILAVSTAVAPAHSAESRSIDRRFSFEHLQKVAETLSTLAQLSPQRVAGPFLKLDYDAYRLISPRNDNALFRDADLPFWAEFFSAGFLFEYPVQMNTVDADGRVETLKPDDRWFQFRGATEGLAHEPGGGFSGFRLLSLLPGEQNKSEFAVFQGASYFRAIGAKQWYGASARGLAIDIGLGTPEEFPRFTRFWIEKPQADAKQVRAWALLDSPAVVGAYQFTITPGDATTLDIEAHLWFRHGVQKVGVAPLTSMWMWDAATKPANDPRPQVHDSDTLWIDDGAKGPTIQPLERPTKTVVRSFPVEQLHGFGLLQRDRDYAHYQDDEAHYDRRPSVWVAPDGDWGPGRIELLELPSEHEGGDNIGAYFVSDKPAAAHDYLKLKYRVVFGDAPPAPH